MVNFRIAIASLALLVGTEVAAHAECAAPDWFGTPSGVALPAQGTLYRNKYDGVVPVPYHASGSLTVGAHWNQQTYPIDPLWEAPASAPRVVTIMRSRYSWTCSEQDAVAMQLNQSVAAVRVFWAYDGQRHEQLVVPRPVQTRTGVPAAVILLGKIDCAGENIPVSALESGVVLGMTAIRFDGSEVRVDGVPSMVALGDLSVEKKQIAVSLLQETWNDAPVQVSASPPLRRSGGHGVLILTLLGGAIVIGARRGRASANEPWVKVPGARARKRKR
jgi:hypothetical protein